MEIWRFIGASFLLSIIQSVLSDSDPFDYFQNNQFDEYEHSPGEPLSPLDFQNAEKLNISSSPSSMNSDKSDPIEIAGLYEGDIILPSSLRDEKEAKNAIKHESQKWINGIIPYLISSQFDQRERSIIARAISEFHSRTCITFKPRSNEVDYIQIGKGDGCSSAVGRIGGNQTVTLGQGCVTPGIAIHELMHAVGFWHEQSRYDRDDYVTVYFQNIKKDMEFNFQKLSWKDIQNLSTIYDTGSIMHYGQFAFSKAPNMPTILPKNPNDRIGQRINFSENDIKKINTLYKCSKGNQEHGSAPTPFLPTASPPSQEKCADSHKNCKRWSDIGECEKNPSWMLVNCKKSCSQCDSPCSDTNDHCPAWGSRGECGKNPGYMHTHCPKSCKRCDKKEVPSDQSGNNNDAKCEDKDAYCSSWAARGECEKNPKYMLTACAKSCNSCRTNSF